MKTNQEILDELKSEWRDGSTIILDADDHRGDHCKIKQWVARFLEEGARNEDDKLLLNRIYHSLNFDIPFRATANVRAELLEHVRARLRAGQSA
jgi:hypothetical protein